MDRALIDTDLLSEVLKAKDQQVLTTARRYIGEHGRFTFSEITVYEIVRGILAKRATRQLEGFLKIVGTSDVVPISRSILMRAAELWAEARRSGRATQDADVIIAATAIESGLMLVTGNTSHFDWIGGLKLADWRQP